MSTTIDYASAAAAHDRHFRTDHLMTDLRGRSIRGGVITLGAQGMKFILQLASTMILARLLTPADFGLVAMVTAITGFVGMFKDLGLSMATIQRPHITHAQVSTLFWVNVGLSVLLTALTVALAPAIAWFYAEPRLIPITLALAATFILGGLTVQHQALLSRQMCLGALAVVDVASLACGIAAAITVALAGHGHWALVAMAAASSLVNAALVWTLSAWRPGLPVRGAGVRSMLAFGGNLSGFNLLNHLIRNADNVLIGWWWGAGPLGLYGRAYQLLVLPLGQINAPIAAVAIPALSRLHEQPDRYARYYLRAVNNIMWMTAPLIALMAACPEELITILLGRQWIEAAGVFRILAIAAVFQPVYNTIGWIFVSQGRTNRFLVWALFATPLMVLAFLAGLPFGITGVAAAYTLVFVVGILPWTFPYTFKGTALTLRRLAAALAWPLLAMIVIYVAVVITRAAMTQSTVAVSLPISLVAGSTAFAFCVATLPGMRAEFVALVRLIVSQTSGRIGSGPVVDTSC